MARGKSVNIPEQISDKYMAFGILLLDDTVVDEISHRYLKDHVQINTEILRRWINGEGRLPVSWETLTACLRDTGLSKLADDIQENIDTFEGNWTSVSEPHTSDSNRKFSLSVCRRTSCQIFHFAHYEITTWIYRIHLR